MDKKSARLRRATRARKKLVNWPRIAWLLTAHRVTYTLS
jgi:hypothetical protein